MAEKIIQLHPQRIKTYQGGMSLAESLQEDISKNLITGDLVDGLEIEDFNEYEAKISTKNGALVIERPKESLREYTIKPEDCFGVDDAKAMELL